MCTYIHTYLPTYLRTYVRTYIGTYVCTLYTIQYNTMQYITLHYFTLHYIKLHTYIHAYIHHPHVPGLKKSIRCTVIHFIMGKESLLSLRNIRNHMVSPEISPGRLGTEEPGEPGVWKIFWVVRDDILWQKTCVYMDHMYIYIYIYIYIRMIMYVYTCL